MVTAGILPFRENSHGRTGNRTRDLMISSQRLWPLDHEAGPVCKVSYNIESFKIKQFIYILYFVWILAKTLEYPRVLCEVHWL